LREQVTHVESFNKNNVHGFKLASKGSRFLANIVETLIYTVTIYIPYILAIRGSLKGYLNGNNSPTFEFAAVFGLIVGAICYPLFTGNLGHRIFGLKVIHEKTGEDFNKAADGGIRELIKGVFSFFIIPIIWLLWDDKNQNLYDKLTKTLVVEK